MDIRRLIAVVLELTAEFCGELAEEVNPPKKKAPRPKPVARYNWWEGVAPK